MSWKEIRTFWLQKEDVITMCTLINRLFENAVLDGEFSDLPEETKELFVGIINNANDEVKAKILCDGEEKFNYDSKCITISEYNDVCMEFTSITKSGKNIITKDELTKLKKGV